MNRGFKIAATVLGFVAVLLFFLGEEGGHAVLAGAVACLAASEL